MSEYVTQASCAESMEAMEREIQSLVSLGEGVPEIELEVEVAGMTAYPTDKTLTVEDMAADAKTVGDKFNDLEADVADIGTDVEAIQAWTGEDIKISSATGAPTIAEAFDIVTSDAWPVGSIWMTISENEPPFFGTWVEVALTTTIAQLKTGRHGYTELEEGETGGDVHFWLRTE